MNNAAISSVTYNVTGQQALNVFLRNTPIFVESMTVAGNPSPLSFFNSATAIIRNNNLVNPSASGSGGVGVYNTSAPTSVRIHTDGLAAYQQAVISASLNTNLMNYLFYDGTLSGMPNAATADYDILYYHAWAASDYLVVAERDGNTFFELTPLGANGNPIPGANRLLFGDNRNSTQRAAVGLTTPLTGDPHDWNTLYRNQNDAFSSQSMWFTAARVSQFFAGTQVAPADQHVYGFRIDNNGNADVKFFGASDNTFEDNFVNPLVPPIPEPSTLLFVAALAPTLLLRRRRLRVMEK